MGIIKDDDKKMIADHLAREMVNPVRIVFFTQRTSEQMGFVHECHICQDAGAMLAELAQLNDKIKVESYDIATDRAKADEYRIERIPGMAIFGARNYGMRYYGVPTGFEFNVLVQAVIDVSRGASDLGPLTREKLKGLGADVHVQLFVTPTCPYCPGVARTLYKMAIENPRVHVSVIEAMEFITLAQRYDVRGVPRIVVNETLSFEGALPESGLLAFILKAGGAMSDEEFSKELAKYHHH